MTKSTAPTRLNEIQKWFGSIISNPLNPDQTSQALTPNGCPLAEDAPKYICKSPTMQPHERIQVYNQQYWWRFYHTMHNAYPLVVRLFGYTDFNLHLVTPYLVAYPSKTWSLKDLGEKFPEWIEKYYTEEDKNLILACASIDWAFHDIFSVPELKPISFQSLTPHDFSELINTKLKLQLHVRFFEFNGAYMPFRDEFLKEPVEHWLENDFPKCVKDRKYYYMIYRVIDGPLFWQEITLCKYKILSLLEKGSSIAEACDALELEGDEIFQEAIDNIQDWFKEWVQYGWLVDAKTF